MISNRRCKNLFINASGLLFFSFIAVKSIIIISKLICSWFFGIETKLVNYRLMGISPSNSGVWNKTSVLAFYSLEMVVPIVIFTLFFILFLKGLKKNHTFSLLFYLSIAFASMHSFFSGITAGIITHTNLAHFFDWLLMPNFGLIALTIIMAPSVFVFAWFFNRYYLIASPNNDEITQLHDQRTIIIFSLLAPALFTSLALFLPICTQFHRYDFIELAIFASMPLPALLYFKKYKCPRKSKSFTEKPQLFILLLMFLFSIIYMLTNVL